MSTQRVWSSMRTASRFVGDLGRDSRWEWIHFRAPDGNLYELASRRRRA
jgi:hypothetical protein